MPLYEYECQQCRRRLEKIRKFSDPPLTLCPHCGGELQQTITAPAVQFKGAGWYKDLYSSPKPPAAASSGDGAGDGSSKSSEGASTPAGDSKPAAPAASAPASTAGASSSGS